MIPLLPLPLLLHCFMLALRADRREVLLVIVLSVLLPLRPLLLLLPLRLVVLFLLLVVVVLKFAPPPAS